MRYLLVCLLFALPCFAASNQHIVPSHDEIQAPSDEQTTHCQDVLKDHIVISQYAAGGCPKDKLEALANRATDIDDVRRASILKLIEEAYSAPDPTEWLNGYWLECMK